MKNLINNIKSDRITLRGFLLSFLLNIITIIYILLNYKALPPFLPIFNQLPWGDQRFTQTPGIFITVVIFSLIFVINLVISSLVYAKNPLIARILAATTFLIAIMNLIFIVRTILVIL
jgi:hypothetical protein